MKNTDQEDDMQLTLPEELFLLTLDEERGTVVESTGHLQRYGIAGAILAELALAGRVSIDARKRLALLETPQGGDPIFDLAVAAIQEIARPHKFTYWVQRLGKKTFRQGISDSLIAKGALARQEKRYLWVVPFPDSATLRASAKYAVKLRLREAVLVDSPPDSRTLILLNLAKACQLFPLVFTKDERAIAKRRIQELEKARTIDDLLRETLQEIETATLAVVMSSTTFL